MAKLVLKTENQVHGRVEIDGDSLTAVFSICFLLANYSSGKVTNVPRSKKVMEFLKLLSDCNINLAWDDEKTVHIKDSFLSNDLSLLRAEENDNYITLLVATLIAKRQSSILSGKHRAVAKFYRKIGFMIEPQRKKIVVSCELTQGKVSVLDVQNAPLHEQMAIYLISQVFPEMPVRYSRDFVRRVNFIDLLEKQSPQVAIQNPMSRNEFCIFTTLGATSELGLEIAGFDPELSIDQLTFLDEVCADFEVKKTLKIWHSFVNVKNIYDFSRVPVDILAYNLLILSLYVPFSCKAVVKNTKSLQAVVKELNIIGCKIKVKSDEMSDYIEIIIEKADLSILRVSINNSEWGGVLLVAAILSGVKVEIDSFEFLENDIPSLRDKLRGIDVRIY